MIRILVFNVPSGNKSSRNPSSEPPAQGANRQLLTPATFLNVAADDILQ